LFCVAFISAAPTAAKDRRVALKDLLVYLDATERAQVCLHLSMELARRHGSRVTALYVKHWSDAQLAERRTAELGQCSFEQLRGLDHGIEASIEASAEALRLELRRIAQDCGVEAEWRCLDGAPSALLPQHARYADLCILGQSALNDAATSADYNLSEQVLFVSGRPVLFIPTAGEFDTLGRHVAIAWNASRPAARALSDAMPLIEKAERTTILTVNSASVIGKHGALPPMRLVDHLRRHGAVVEDRWIEKISHGSIADALQDQAQAAGADVLVAGAFGHAQLREKLLGSVTRDLLERTSLPLMMAH
jgi:nucleotide-binding universal stress UspA family protein